MGEYTADQIRAIALHHGYTFLTRDVFDTLKKRGLIPRPRRIVSPPGEKRRYGVWDDTDVTQVLDLCWLHERNARARTLALGLWLHGHDVPAVQGDTGAPLEVRDLLVGRLEWIQSIFLGEVLHTSDHCDENKWNTLYSSLNKAVMDLSSHALVDVCYGREPDRDVSWHGGDWEDLLDQDLEAPESAVRNFTRPVFVALEQIGTTKRGEPIYRFPPGEKLVEHLRYPNPRLSTAILESGQRVITESLLVARLGLDPGAQGWTLSALIDTVTTATLEQLGNARAHVFMNVMHLLDGYCMLSGHVRGRRIDLPALRSSFGTERHLFGCQELAPLVALLIALQLDARTVVSRDDDLLVLALVRLVEAGGDVHLQRGAIARLLCAFSPPAQSALGNPQINQAVWEQLQRTIQA